VIGLQWGDEAKGKIVDLLTRTHEMVVRYQGGSNAGHTVVSGGTKYKLSLVPSGILRPNVPCLVTGGVVLHPPRVLEEMERLRGQGVEIGENLLISERAHVVFPWHLEEERLRDARPGGAKIGTTMRGIGPCYRDKAGRNEAIRLGDLYRASFRETVDRITESKNELLAALAVPGEFRPLNADEIYEEYSIYADALRIHRTDTTPILLNALEAGRRVLFEGAQGALLDVDHGTYPYVTSSNSSGTGISSGSGVPGRYFNHIIGVLKAYNTRVGGGPFPTEDLGETGELIRQRGNEYGTVTGRPRRCGWFDCVAARYTARISGVDVLAVMLLDVLDTMAEIKICTGYEIDGRVVTDFPSHVDDLAAAKPIYETLPGWQQDLTGVRSIGDLPTNARAYLDRISEIIGRPVEIVSVGPDREQTMFASNDLAAA
jgi:adenylosuccinate synthase